MPQTVSKPKHPIKKNEPAHTAPVEPLQLPPTQYFPLEVARLMPNQMRSLANSNKLIVRRSFDPLDTFRTLAYDSESKGWKFEPPSVNAGRSERDSKDPFILAGSTILRAGNFIFASRFLIDTIEFDEQFKALPPRAAEKELPPIESMDELNQTHFIYIEQIKFGPGSTFAVITNRNVQATAELMQPQRFHVPDIKNAVARRIIVPRSNYFATCISVDDADVIYVHELKIAQKTAIRKHATIECKNDVRSIAKLADGKMLIISNRSSDDPDLDNRDVALRRNFLHTASIDPNECPASVTIEGYHQYNRAITRQDGTVFLSASKPGSDYNAFDILAMDFNNQLYYVVTDSSDLSTEFETVGDNHLAFFSSSALIASQLSAKDAKIQSASGLEVDSKKTATTLSSNTVASASTAKMNRHLALATARAPLALKEEEQQATVNSIVAVLPDTYVRDLIGIMSEYAYSGSVRLFNTAREDKVVIIRHENSAFAALTTHSPT